MNEIRHGDCLELMKELPDKSVDMILCDLPYGTTKNKWDAIIPFDKLWKQYNRVIKNDGAIVLFSTGLFTHQLVISNLKGYKYDIVWHKSKSGSSFTAKYRPVNKHEIINIFSVAGKKVKYNPQLVKGEPYSRVRTPTSNKPNNHKLGVTSKSETINTGFRYPSTVQYFQQKWRRQDQIHPTQKPVALFEYLIKTYTNEGDLVLDNCAGSGTTNIACHNTNRQCIGMEKDENYFKIATKRLENCKKQEVLEGTKR